MHHAHRDDYRKSRAKVALALACLWLGGLLLSALPACAEPDLRVVTESWPPYSYEEDGKVVGTATGIVVKVLERAGVPYSLGLYPWSRAYAKALNDKNTVIYALVNSAERAGKFDMIGQVAPTDRLYFYRLKARPDVQFETLERARGFVVGASRDSVMEAFLVHNDFPRTRIVMATANAFMLLERRRVDIVISSETNAHSLLERAGKPADLYVPVMMAEESRPFMALGRNADEGLSERLREAYQALVSEGEIPNFK